MKKLVSFLLALVLLAGQTACASSEGEKSPNDVSSQPISTRKAGESFHAKTPLTVSMLFSDNAGYPMKDDWLLWKALTEKTNVTLKIQSVPGSDFSSKESVLIGSGEMPDIAGKCYGADQYVASGMILPVSDYINLMPDYAEKVSKWNLQKEVDATRAANGKYYRLPGLHQDARIEYSFLVRTDELKKLGLSEPKNLDDFYNMLKQMKAANPSQYPFSDEYKAKATLQLFAGAYHVGAGWGSGNYYSYNKEKDQFEYMPLTDQYKEFLSYAHKLVEEKLMDPESFSQTDDQAAAKFVNGKSWVMSGNTQNRETMITKLDQSLGAGKYGLDLITPPTIDGTVNGSRLECGIMLNNSLKDNPRFEEIMSFIDWLWYSDEGQTFCKWGVEGTTYTVKDGNKVLMPDITFNGLNPTGKKDLRKDYGFSCGNFSYGGSTELEESIMGEREKNYFRNNRAVLKLRDPDPANPMSEDEQDQLNGYVTPLNDYVTSMTEKFILGSANLDTGWDSFKSELKSKHCDELMSFVNEVYKANKEKTAK